jgi:hypothetical protein
VRGESSPVPRHVVAVRPEPAPRCARSRIDEALLAFRGRALVSRDQVVDALLDLRRAVQLDEEPVEEERDDTLVASSPERRVMDRTS